MRSQNKILAGSSKTTVVLFVTKLFLLFEKTESSEPFFRQFAKFAVSDSTDSMRFHFQS